MMKEQLSALIDGEFDIDNAEHLIATAKSESEMNHAWAMYHLIGDAMRGDNVTSVNLSSKIMSAIADEPVMFAPQSKAKAAQESQTKQAVDKNQAVKQPVVWSVAASIAAVFFVGLMLLQNQGASNTDLTPIEMADNQTSDYLNAHQTYAPTSAAYYIQNASYPEQQ